MFKSLVFMAAGTALGIACAQAATLTDVSGAVFVDKGSGFVRAVSGTAVSTGDRVRVDSGAAMIDYGNGRIMPLSSGQVIAVPLEPASMALSSMKDPCVVNSSVVPCIDTGDLLIGGVVAGGITAGVILIENSQKQPASP
jgi:hypothetical protein